MPPLRDRIADIPLLAEHFLRRICDDCRKNVRGFTDEAMLSLQRYPWPGNVRELQNVIERAVLLGKGDRIGVDDLPGNLTLGAATVFDPSANQPLKTSLASPERQIIREVLEANAWNRHATAAALGINRTTLYKKMKRLGLQEPRPARAGT